MTTLEVTKSGTKIKEDKLEDALTLNYDMQKSYMKFMDSFNRKFNIGGAVKDAESRNIQISREARKNLFG